MRKYENDKLIKIICNKCGRKMSVDMDIVKEGVCTVEKDWGYFSGKDGEHHQFDLCEECYDAWIKSFVIPAEIRENTELI
ncbi:MAG: hypothetical protein EOM40_17950 [Clostridia bacterium]|nr:hypothetical protein [Clostridia bacterium]NCC44574.1 hypothetical protein [Clostridia bacterium]